VLYFSYSRRTTQIFVNAITPSHLSRSMANPAAMTSTRLQHATSTIRECAVNLLLPICPIPCFMLLYFSVEIGVSSVSMIRILSFFRLAFLVIFVVQDLFFTHTTSEDSFPFRLYVAREDSLHVSLCSRNSSLFCPSRILI